MQALFPVPNVPSSRLTERLCLNRGTCRTSSVIGQLVCRLALVLGIVGDHLVGKDRLLVVGGRSGSSPRNVLSWRRPASTLRSHTASNTLNGLLLNRTEVQLNPVERFLGSAVSSRRTKGTWYIPRYIPRPRPVDDKEFHAFRWRVAITPLGHPGAAFSDHPHRLPKEIDDGFLNRQSKLMEARKLRPILHLCRTSQMPGAD